MRSWAVSDHRVKIDLKKVVQQAVDQLAESEGRALLQRWVAESGGQEQIVEIELASVLVGPDEPEFCPRCGYETVDVRDGRAYCGTCGLGWLIEG